MISVMLPDEFSHAIFIAVFHCMWRWLMHMYLCNRFFVVLLTYRKHDDINNFLINAREHFCNQMVYINEACENIENIVSQQWEHFVHEVSSSWSGSITDIKPSIIDLMSSVTVFQED